MEESNILSARNVSRSLRAFSFDCLMVLNIPRTNPAMPHIPTIMLTMINMLSISTSCSQATLDCYRKGDFDNNITIDNLQLRMVENALLCRFFGHLPQGVGFIPKIKTEKSLEQTVLKSEKGLFLCYNEP